MDNIPTKPDWVINIAEGWPLGLTAHDGGFTILQPRQFRDSIRWEFAAYIPGPMAELIAKKIEEGR